MNILILTHSYPDTNHKWRGVFIQEQARALSVKHNIIVVYFKVDYSHFAPFSKYRFLKKNDERITIYEVTVNKSLPIITQLKYLSNTYKFVNKEILNNIHIDIIHSHLSYPAGFLGTLIQKRKKIPNILTEHSWIRKYFRSRIHRICVLYTLNNVNMIVSVSGALKKDIATFCKRKIEVIPNVVETERFKISKIKMNKTLNLGLLGGMDNFRKGLDVLLKAVSLLKNTDLLVHIGGDGVYLDHFKRMAKELLVYEKCKFYGEIRPEKVTDFFSALDIFVLASRDETFGVVVVEAMSCGLPVIATKCGGPEEIISEETGVLVELNNPEELARAILYVSENMDLYNRIHIKEYAMGKYGQKKFVERTTSIYQEVIIKTAK